MPITSPVDIKLPPWGVLVRESVHHRDFHMSLTCDPFNEGFHVVRGRIELLLGDARERGVLPEGSYSCVPTGMPHRVVDSSSSTLLLLCLSDSIVTDSPERQAVWREIVTNCPWVAQPQTKQEMEELHHHWRQLMGFQQLPDTPRTRLAILAQLNESLLTLHDLRTKETGLDASSRVRATVREIEEQAYDHWSVHRAARKAHLSARRFSELFKQETGATFIPWLQKRRIHHACRLLASGNFTIAGAAFSSGFEDLSHFYRVFQKICGRTPRQWVLDHEGRPIKPPPPPSRPQ